MYGYDNYQKVKEIIDNRYRTANAEADVRNAQVRGESEEIREIDRELVTTGLRLFKAACTGEDITPIRERNIALMERRADILISLGYTADYTLPRYTCQRCNDTGYIGDRMCSCFRELLVKENLKSSGIGALIDRQSFENFDTTSPDPEIAKKMKKNLKRARAYVSSFEVGKSNNLLLLGNTGTGKTHISTAIARELIELGYEVLYDSCDNILQAIISDRFENRAGRGDSARYTQCDLLILDDLGAEYVNQLSIATLYNLLNTRINKGLPTLISSNLSPELLRTTYDDRIYSRLFGPDTELIYFVGADKRLSE